MALDVLSYRMASRPTGVHKLERAYPEWVINGVPLLELLRQHRNAHAHADYVPAIVWLNGEDEVHRLMLERPADLPDDRHSILVCPECGNPDCGVLSVVIEQHGSEVTWQSFATEQMADDPDIGWRDLTRYEGFGPFRFDLAAYRDVLWGMQRIGLSEFHAWRSARGR